MTALDERFPGFTIENGKQAELAQSATHTCQLPVGRYDRAFPVLSGFARPHGAHSAIIGPNALLIATHALSVSLTVVTAQFFEGELVGPKPPGLHIKRCWTCTSQKEVTCPGLKVELPDLQTVLLASVPLDDQGWEGLEEGTILALKDGEVLTQI